MSDPQRQLKEAFRALAAEAEAGEHPSPLELVSGSEEVQAHLALCAECAVLAGELSRFGPAEPRSAAEEAEAAGVWARLRPQLPGSLDPPQEALDPPQETRVLGGARRFQLSPGWLGSLAAVLAAVTLGLTFWAGNLERRLNQLARPEANAPIFDLLGSSVARSSSRPERQRITVPPTSRFYTLVLPAPSASATEPHRVEILAADGAVAWQGTGFEPNRWGSFTLMLPSDTLPEGDFTLKVLATPPEGPRLIEEYAFSVARSADRAAGT